MSLFDFFKRKGKMKPTDFVDANGKVTKSSVVDKSNGERYLSLSNMDCAIVLHEDNKIEVIFTKAYDVENQTITENEQTLMALACFMKQPGFLEMIVSEFNKIALEKISTLTDNIDESK